MSFLIGCFIALVFALFALLIGATVFLVLDRDDDESKQKRRRTILRAVRGKQTDDPPPAP